ncbi:ABC transporter ATP-binding protein [Archaeoglobales archaeon]|nr:MAG: ABC transporter ATP-binding protein [Archaeoglobales archaeon]RLI80167.1 MAG: ABC transporter ATP-binding protein [Archaeoglobales archaeon]
MLLDVKNLKTYFYSKRGVLRAVDNVSIGVDRREFISIVGESGCGKSTLAYSIIRLVDTPGKIVDGKIVFDGRDLVKLSEEEMRRLRGKEIGMVFQDPMTSLDPLEKIGDQIVETIIEHERVDKKEAWEKASILLEKVGLPGDRVNYYPHQLSGGQRQRVMIALAVSLNPKLLIADEPTTALDVIVQEKIMDLLEDMKKEDRAIILITHDFALAADRSDKIAVMYAGWLIEFGKANKLANEPLHPYSEGLIGSVPDVWEDRDIKPMLGFLPDLIDPPKGCRFKPRCPKAMDVCDKEPPTFSVDGRVVKCWLYGENNG